MNKKIKHLLLDHDDDTSKIAADLGVSRTAVWRELRGERLSAHIRLFISSRWGISYDRFMALTQSSKILKRAA
jgi:transcriptional regulator with XRE-family HTH domain